MSENRKKRPAAFYMALTMALCLFPLIGLLWYHGAVSSENRKLSDFPRLRTEEGWNPEFLSEAGAYFEEHFAWRQEMVTADARLRGTLFGVSTADGVIVGTDGWLYYRDSLDDYLGSNPLSDRAVFNIARTLKLMQDYAEKNGRQFLFTVAPNKNSLYGDHMPYYYQVKAGTVHNIDRLEEALRAQGIHYADLYEVFEAQDEVLYHKRDSHWNNKGAALAAETLLDALGKEHASYGDADCTVRADFEGDLDVMLYPEAVTKEEEIYYTEPFTYQYEGDVESNFDPEITTTCAQGSGGLLMYRDSFGNALLPFLAEEYADARFSRGVPYYPDDMFFCGADTILVERAERFLPDMAQNPPVMQAPEAEVSLLKIFQLEVSSEDDAVCSAEDEGLFVKISGAVDASLLDTESRIYVSVDREQIYEAFPMSLAQDTAAEPGGSADVGEITAEPNGNAGAGVMTEEPDGNADTGTVTAEPGFDEVTEKPGENEDANEITDEANETADAGEGVTAVPGNACGFAAYIGKEQVEGSELNIEVYVETDGEFRKVEQNIIEIN